MTSQQNMDTVGVILAGGKSRRMGVADKCLLALAGAPMLEHVIAQAKPKLHNCCSQPMATDAFHRFRLPIVADVCADQGGPLAGIISAMGYTSKLRPQPRWLATFPCDAPLAPAHWVSHLRATASERTTPSPFGPVRALLCLKSAMPLVTAHYIK